MRKIGILLAAGAMASLAACANMGGPMADGEPANTGAPAGEGADAGALGAATGDVAYAQLKGADGAMHGRAVLTEYANGVEVVTDLQNVPAGQHGLHIHETGVCTAPDFTSAGGHWNPTNEPHPEHKGDLGNVTIAAGGTGQLTATIEGVSLNGSMTPIMDADGSGMILHAGPDDLTSQPSGAAGARLACAVITMG